MRHGIGLKIEPRQLAQLRKRKNVLSIHNMQREKLEDEFMLLHAGGPPAASDPAAVEQGPMRSYRRERTRLTNVTPFAIPGPSTLGKMNDWDLGRNGDQIRYVCKLDC